MSESTGGTPAAKLRRRPFLIAIAIIVLLGIFYLAVYLMLPGGIRSAYQENKCEQVLSRADTFARLFAFASMDDELAESVQECAVYTLAVSHADQGVWREAYHALTVYSALYPDGRFAPDVRERMATALIGLTREKIVEQKYREALQDIDRILQDFNDTRASTEAKALQPELNRKWGASLRESGDFAQAERIFLELLQDKESDNAQLVQHELARTYMMWSLALQAQKQFAEAKLKLDTALATDPDPASDTGISDEARAGQVELFQRWGDHLLVQGDYDDAMGRYVTAANLIQDTDPAAAQEIVANGYIHWAKTLSDRDDFLGALVLLDFAQTNAATDATRALVDEARSETYLAFSQSDGGQARKAILDAASSVCAHQTAPRLPIFGLDQENVRVVVNGAEGELPEKLAVTTPGSMHYVACVQEERKVAGSAVHAVGSFVFDQNASYRLVQVLYQSFQFVWNVTLRKVDRGDEVEVVVIEGGEPPALPATIREIYAGATNPNYYGTKPVFSDLVTWLETAVK